MKLLLDILQGLGVASATGLRPFLPAIAAGGFALADLGVDFDGTAFSFLESPIWLVVLVLALIASLVLRARLEEGPGDAVLGGIGIALGALLCAASIDDRHDTWWYGLLIGAAVAYLASGVSRGLISRVRSRFASSGEREAAATLPLYAEVAGLLVAALSILFPPLSILAIGFLIALLVTGRRRSGQKYAGLRILR
jgi:hypothetical protein